MAVSFPVTQWGGFLSVIVELGLPSWTATDIFFFDSSAAKFDTALFGSDSVWTDFSSRAASIVTHRRCSRENGEYTGGTAEIVLDNSDYWLSEDNQGSPYHGKIGAATPVRAWLDVRDPALPRRPVSLFVGKASDWIETGPGVGRDATVTIPCVDAFEGLAAFDGYAQTPQGSGELSGARIHRLLSNVGYTGPRNIDIGVAYLQATTLAANTLSELKTTTASEGGRLWVEADGTVTFSGRYGLMEDAESAAPAIMFTDVPVGTANIDAGPLGVGVMGDSPLGGQVLTVAALQPGAALGSTLSGVTIYGPSTIVDKYLSKLVFSEPVVKSSKDLLRNMAAYARLGSTAQRAADATSRQLYGDRRLSRSDLINVDDPSVAALATRDVALRKDKERRVESITFRPLMQPTPAAVSVALQWIAAARLWHQVRVQLHPDAAPFTTDRNVFVTGISHKFTTTDWTVGLDFQSATVWNTFRGSLFDTTAVYDAALMLW